MVAALDAGPADDKWLPLSRADCKRLEEARAKGEQTCRVDGGRKLVRAATGSRSVRHCYSTQATRTRYGYRWQVHFEDRRVSPIFHSGPVQRIVRGTYFWKLDQAKVNTWMSYSWHDRLESCAQSSSSTLYLFMYCS
jgi:hypothetical protein